MSFSKAKIQRFNDIKANGVCQVSCVDQKTKTITKIKSTKSSVPSDKASTKSSENISVKSTPCFRQPKLVIKKTVKPKVETYSKEYVELEALKEKIVECENKDACIKDLAEQVDEIKEKMITLERQKSKLVTEKAQYEEAVEILQIQEAKRLEKLSVDFKEEMAKKHLHQKKLLQDIDALREEYQALKNANRVDIVNLKMDLEAFEKLSEKFVEEHNSAVAAKVKELQQKEQELGALEKNCIEMQKNHSIEIERLNKEHQLEIQDIEFEMLKTMTELQREKENAGIKMHELESKLAHEMENIKAVFDMEKTNILMQSEEKLQEIETKYSRINCCFESKLQEKIVQVEAEWQIKLKEQEKEAHAILKECQAISEYNIIQSEVEKNKIQTQLDEKIEELGTVQQKYEATLRNYEDLSCRHKNLQNDLSNIILELNDTRKNLSEQLSDKEKQISQFAKEKIMYEITIKNSQVTIEVLTKRLMNSDKDVVQLKNELSDCEETILKYEQKHLQLTSELKQAQTYNEEVEMQYESAIKLNRTEIEKLGSELHERVDLYKKQVDGLAVKLDEEKNLKKEIMHKLQEAYNVIDKLKIEVENLAVINSQYQFEIEQSQNELEDYHMRELDWNIIKDKFEDMVKELEQNLEQKQDEIVHLNKQIDRLMAEQQENVRLKTSEQQEEETIYRKYIQMSGKYDEILQKYEILQEENRKLKTECELMVKKHKNLEKHTKNVDRCTLKKKLEESEDEKTSLKDKIQLLEKELSEVSQKYAHLAGHQNNKQKIKHLEDLKLKNNELNQNVVDLDIKLRSHTKTIEKLKKENADLKKYLKKSKFHLEDKENIASPTRSLNSSRIESPLRDRN